eukprot:9270107-Pyramimonas_sp.AAC.1
MYHGLSGHLAGRRHKGAPRTTTAPGRTCKARTASGPASSAGSSPRKRKTSRSPSPRAIAATR